MFIPLTGDHPLDWRSSPWLEVIPGADHVSIQPGVEKWSSNTFWNLYGNLCATAPAWPQSGRNSHIFLFGPKAAGDANCMICMMKGTKNTQKSEIPILMAVFPAGPLTPVGGENSHHIMAKRPRGWLYYTSPKRNKLQLAKFQTPASHTSSLSREGDNSIWFDVAPIFGSSRLFLFLEMLPKHPQPTKTTSIEISIQWQSKVKAGSTMFSHLLDVSKYIYHIDYKYIIGINI